MPLYRCNACGYVAEENITPVGKSMSCNRCAQPVTVFGTVFYVEKLLERYTEIRRELQALRALETPRVVNPPLAPEERVAPATATQKATETNLATLAQHAPLQAWFQSHQLQVDFDIENVNTAGYFDEAAQAFGTRYELFGELIGRVCWSYRKAHTGLNLELARLPQKDAQAINQLCRNLYEHTFFSRYHYQKPEKIVRLSLQSAPAVRRFFEGGWLEWFALMEVLAVWNTHQPRLSLSVARGARIKFANEDLQELDVLALSGNHAPVCIECKTGEFRRDLDKLLRLRKRLGIPRERFIICALDLDDAQASSLNAMYDMSFVTLSTLRPHLQHLCSGQ
ncbi:MULTISPECIES: PDDEXK family nuclease [Giesbergeria]|uniref:DUF1887 family protein n=1 Tax=Giesbergeria sinuosa TaxID=80883 RepID=A0ABV9QL31_9BURK